jgi:transcriptional antiterminator RfaH
MFMPILGKEVALFPENLLHEFATDDAQREHAWWVAHTRPRQEKALARSLFASEIPFYLPLVGKEVHTRGKRRTSFVPVFASYVFLFAREEQRLTALKTDRIVQTLPAPDGGELRQDLQNIQRLIELDAPLTVERRIQPGAWVRVRRGPMEGLEGTVESRKGKTRLIVLVRMLQQGVSLEIDDILLEPI